MVGNPRDDAAGGLRPIRDLPGQHRPGVGDVGSTQRPPDVDADRRDGNISADVPSRAPHVEVRRAPDVPEVGEPEDHPVDVRPVRAAAHADGQWPRIDVVHRDAHGKIAVHPLRLQFGVRAYQHALVEELIGERRRGIRSPDRARDDEQPVRQRHADTRRDVVAPEQRVPVAPSARLGCKLAVPGKREPDEANRAPRAEEPLRVRRVRREHRRFDLQCPRLAAEGKSGRAEVDRRVGRNRDRRRIDNLIVRATEWR